MKFKLLRSEPVKADVRSFIFEPEQPVSWQPGQYFHYLLPHPDTDDRGEERWFTNAAAPSEKHVMISTRVIAERKSSFKNTLSGLRPGDTIEADGPEGDFTVEDFSRNYIFVAGGIGITPFRSILVEAHSRGQHVKATLLYANRTNDIPFADELERLAADNPDLKIEYIVGPQRIDKALLQRYITAVDNPLVYVSGPEPMVKSLADQLAELDLDKANIKTDDFPGYEAI